MEVEPASASAPDVAAAPEAAAAPAAVAATVAAAAPAEPEAREAALKRGANQGEAAGEGSAAEAGEEEPAAKRAHTEGEAGEDAAGEGAGPVGDGEKGEGEAAGAAGEGSAVKEEVLTVGPKQFESGLAMFHFFFELVKSWPLFKDVNEYEKLVLMDLLKKGHSDPASKIGPGIKSFQVRMHPEFRSQCFFVVRTDGTFDDFSFRKCVERLVNLPAEFLLKGKTVDVSPRGGGRGGGRGGRGGRGGWRGGRGRGGGGRKRY